MGVRIEKQGSVFTVVLHRPEVRNAVDRPTADALVEAFVSFERDETAKVAVLWGEGGTFCAGADLKSFGTDRHNRVEPSGAGPMEISVADLSAACLTPRHDGTRGQAVEGQGADRLLDRGHPRDARPLRHRAR